MKFKTLLFTTCLACALGCKSVQATPPSEAFAVVTDGSNANFHLYWTVFKPAITPAPVVLVIFGGQFRNGNRGDVFNEARDLAAAGYVALAIDYRTDEANSSIGDGQTTPVYAPTLPLTLNPNQPGDVQLAVAAARTGKMADGTTIPIESQYIDPNPANQKVGAVGGSSGASHALWCASTGTPGGNKLDAAVLLSGAYEFDLTNSFSWDGTPINPPCFVSTGTPCPSRYGDDVDEYCRTLCSVVSGTLVCAPGGIAKLQNASPIHRFIDVTTPAVSPLYFVSTPLDHITPFQWCALNDTLSARGITTATPFWLTGQNCSNSHSFQYWDVVKGDSQGGVIGWLYNNLGHP
jgi:dienelactone hydrolase